MPLKIFTKALINSRNIVIALMILISFVFFNWEPLLLIGVFVYLTSAIQLFLSQGFRQKCLKDEKIKEIRRLNYKTSLHYYRVRAKAAKNFTTKIIEKIFCILGKNSYVDLESRVNSVYYAKSEIVNTFMQKEYSHLRAKIALKAVELAEAYFKMMDTYLARLADVSTDNLSSIEVRISQNKRRKISSGNLSYANELERAIEADEKLLDRLKESKKEVEKMSAKISTIESTINLLKQQIYLEFDSEADVEKIETIVKEAEAFENALDVHNKSKRKNNA